jgi:hypothetical protein
MKASTAVAVLFLSFTCSQAAHAATQVQCHAMFQKADSNGDGLIGGTELLPFLATQVVAGRSMEATVQMTVNAQEFKEECMREAFRDVALKP